MQDQLDSLAPLLISLLVLLFGVIFLIRLLFGKRVSDALIGRLLYDIFTLPFRIVGFLLKLILRRYQRW